MAQNLVKNMFKGAPPGTRAADVSTMLPTPLTEEIRTQMVYICQAPPVNGKFDNAKAKALKVPNGPMKGDLVRGQTIEFEDPDVPGSMIVVRPEDVVSDGHDGAVSVKLTLIVVDSADVADFGCCQLYGRDYAYVTRSSSFRTISGAVGLQKRRETLENSVDGTSRTHISLAECRIHRLAPVVRARNTSQSWSYRN